MQNNSQEIVPSISPITIETSGTGSEMEVLRADISDDELEAMLLTPPGVLYVHNQDGAVIQLMLDMDEQSLIARAVSIRGSEVEYLDEDAAGNRP